MGEGRRLIPDNVHATATKTTRKAICNVLMHKPLIVSESPNKPNIKYIVHKRPGTLEETFSVIAEQLLQQRTAIDRVLVFCQIFDDDSHLFFIGANFPESISGTKTAPWPHPKHSNNDIIFNDIIYAKV